MAEIIPFQTREQRMREGIEQLRQDTEVMTGMELYNRIRQYAYNNLDDIVQRMKETGKWNDTANSLMRRATENVNAACAAIAGVQHGTTTQGKGRSAVNIPVTGTGRPIVNTAAFFGSSGDRDAAGSDSKRRDDGGGFDRTDCDPGDCS